MKNTEIDALWRIVDSGNPREPLEALKKESALPPPARVLRGIAALDAGLPEEAAEDFVAVMQENPSNPIARLYRALALYQAGKPKDAGELLPRKGEVLFPQHAFITRFIKVFWPLRFTGELGRALIDGETGAGADPFTSDYDRWLAMRDRVNARRLELLEKADSLGETASAIGEAASGLATGDGADHRFVRGLGDRYHKQGLKEYHHGRKALASTLFDRAAELRPENELFATHAASLKMLLGDAASGRALLAPFVIRGVAEFDRTRKAESLTSTDALVSYAWCLHDLEEHQEALLALSLVHPEGPEDLGGHFLAAVCWLQLGNEANYRRAMKECLDRYFIDSWEQIIEPFVRRVGSWLRN